MPLAVVLVVGSSCIVEFLVCGRVPSLCILFESLLFEILKGCLSLKDLKS